MIDKIFRKLYSSSRIFQKMHGIFLRIKSAYWVLTDYKEDPYEKRFKYHIDKFDLTPEQLEHARKYGIFPSSYLVYEYDKWDVELYLSERDLYSLKLKDKGLAPAFADKRNLPLMFLKKSHYLPSLNLAIDKGRIQYIVEDGVYQEGIFDLALTLDQYLKKYSKLIIKPNDYYGGRGIFVISKKLTEETLSWLRKEGNAIINNVLINDEYSQSINEVSLNTIRVNFFKKKDGTLKPISMLHRFGASAESCVDNVSGGGMAASIDIETGELLQAYTIRRKRINIDNHPVSGHQITGFQIPDWDRKKQQIDDLLQEVNYLDYGGLDIAFTTEGLKLIEVNTRYPALRSVQSSYPALIDEEFVEFLRIRGFTRQIPTTDDKS